jgi:hypothetical protein
MKQGCIKAELIFMLTCFDHPHGRISVGVVGGAWCNQHVHVEKADHGVPVKIKIIPPPSL